MNEIPATIGKYKIMGELSRGGMGVVYKSVHPELRRPVVIKRMAMKASALARASFLKEAQILLEMQSPYIVHLYDYFSERSYRYMVEEFVEGLSLYNLLQKQLVLSPQLALLIVHDCCLALHFAHSKNVVHRDIKPGNILISKHGEVKITDFGIASDVSQSDPEMEGIMLGTPGYMPVEQFQNSSEVDMRADIYALGVTLYEMLSGRRPFSGNSVEEVYEKVRKGKYVPLRKLDKSIPPKVAAIVNKMMQTKASNRYKSVEPILYEVKKYLKKYDTYAVRVELAKMVIAPKPISEAKFKTRGDIWKGFFVALVGAAALCGAAFYLWSGGWIHRTVLRYWYTPVAISLRLPTASSPASEIHARAIFFTSDGRIEQIEKSERVFEEGKAASDWRASLKFFKTRTESERLGATAPVKEQNYRIKPIFLKRGRYRAKIVVGSYVWWENFEVSGKSKIIDINLHANESRPLKLSMTAFDGKTGEDLSDRVIFTVLYNNRWVAVNRIPPEQFKSSSVWKFRASLGGYEDEIFSLLIDWYQDTVSIRAEMFPL